MRKKAMIKLRRLISPGIILLFVACKTNTGHDVPVYTLNKGSFDHEIVETGSLTSTQALTVYAPALSWRFGTLKISMLVEDGKEVNTGDVVALIDPSDVRKDIIQSEAELDIAKAEHLKLIAVQESRIYELEAELKMSAISQKIANIQLAQATYESEVTRKEIKLNLDKAEIALNKAKDEIENQKKIQHEELVQSELKMRQLERNLVEAKLTLDMLTIVSPGKGIAILQKNWSTGNKWQVGDQPWSGTPLIDLPDLSELKVLTEINEVDISKVSIGQLVEIRLDAFSDTIYQGEIIKVANLAKYKNGDDKVKVFPVEILIKKTSGSLLPGMTVSCKIIIEKISDVLFVPLEAVFQDQDGDYVYLKTGSSFKRKNVSTGLQNNDFVIIEKGLGPGDKVALKNPLEDKAKEGS